MKSLEAIHRDDAIAASKAAQERKEPLILEKQDIEEGHYMFPYLGDYTPLGWRLCKRPEPLFCDTSGMGAPAERALTVSELRLRLKKLRRQNPNYGYGILSVGPFQLYLGIYLRKKKHKEKVMEESVDEVESAPQDVTPGKISKVLGIPPSTVRHYVRTGRIKGIQDPTTGCWKVPHEEFERFKEESKL